MKRYGPGASLDDLFGRGRVGGRVITVDGYPHSGQPLMLTEFGGTGYVGTAAAKEKAWGYVLAGDLSAFERRFVSLMKVVTGLESFAGFCYTQLTDTYQEVNGLLYANRAPKLPFEMIAKAVQGIA